MNVLLGYLNHDIHNQYIMPIYTHQYNHVVVLHALTLDQCLWQIQIYTVCNYT